MDSSADYLTLKQNAAGGGRLRPGWPHPGGPHGHWKSLNLLHSHATGERQWGYRQRRPGPDQNHQIQSFASGARSGPGVHPAGCETLRPAPAAPTSSIPGLLCPPAGFRHHCNHQTTDLSTFLCFSASSFILSRLLYTIPSCSLQPHTSTTNMTSVRAQTLSRQGVIVDPAQVHPPPLQRLHRPRPATMGITLFSLPGKVYVWVLEMRVRLLVKPQIQEKQSRFSSRSRNTGAALYPFDDTSGCVGVCPTSLHVFCRGGEDI